MRLVADCDDLRKQRLRVERMDKLAQAALEMVLLRFVDSLVMESNRDVWVQIGYFFETFRENLELEFHVLKDARIGQKLDDCARFVGAANGF